MRRARLLRIAGIAVVGVLVLELLRTHVAARYLIPSRSMEPTLHGDPATGDIVLVDKAGWCRGTGAAALARFDTVVVRDRENADRPLVKRVGSLGDEMLRILDGDLFTRPLTGGPWVRVQKDPRHDDLRFTFFAYEASVPATEARERRLAGPGPDGDGTLPLPPLATDGAAALRAVAAAGPRDPRVLASVGPIDVSFVDAAGRRSAATDRCSDDVGVELDVALAPACDALVLALELRGQTFAVAYRRDGALTWAGSTEPGPPHATPLGARASLVFGYLDGRIFLLTDGALDGQPARSLVAALAQTLPASSELVPRNGVRVAAVGAGDAVVAHVRRVRLFHDVYYLGENQPWVGIKEYRVEPAQVFLLGDNSFDSVDSRARGPFPLADVVGRPLAVIGPWRRLRWLPR